MKKVWIAILNQGWMRPELCNFLLTVITQEKRYQLKITYPNRSPEENNRNLIVKDFLDSGFDYLATINSDVVPPQNLLDLIELDKDVIGCPCPQWNEGEIYWAVMQEIHNGFVPAKREGNLQEVDAVGSACLLIARRVLEILSFPFETLWSKDGLLQMSSDFSFCKKAKIHGFGVFTHWGYPCRHFHSLDLGQI